MEAMQRTVAPFRLLTGQSILLVGFLPDGRNLPPSNVVSWCQTTDNPSLVVSHRGFAGDLSANPRQHFGMKERLAEHRPMSDCHAGYAWWPLTALAICLTPHVPERAFEPGYDLVRLTNPIVSHKGYNWVAVLSTSRYNTLLHPALKKLSGAQWTSSHLPEGQGSTVCWTVYRASSWQRLSRLWGTSSSRLEPVG